MTTWCTTRRRWPASCGGPCPGSASGGTRCRGSASRGDEERGSGGRGRSSGRGRRARRPDPFSGLVSLVYTSRCDDWHGVATATATAAAHATRARRASGRSLEHDRPSGARRGADHGADGAALQAARNHRAHNRERRTPTMSTEMQAAAREGPRRSKTMEWVEPGLYRRVDPRSGQVLPKLWIHYPGRNGKTEREPAHTTTPVVARKLRAKRMEQHGRGEAGRAAERIRVDELLTHYQTDA